jgi:leucyl-tRNA synthetase
MSKSLRNVVNPDNIIAQYGADTLRVYLMFMGPLDCSRVWDSKAIAGSYRFLKKAWNFCIGSSERGCRELIDSSDEAVEIKRAIQQCIGKVTDDLERLQFNTAISAMMTFLNLANNKGVSRETVESFVLILSPFAPHLAEELWQRLGHGEGLISQKWPDCDPTILEQESTMVVVQVNGKKRSIVDVASKITDDALKEVVINHMSGTSYQLSSGDRFITVRDSVAGSPKLVNVITGS